MGVLGFKCIPGVIFYQLNYLRTEVLFSVVYRSVNYIGLHAK